MALTSEPAGTAKAVWYQHLVPCLIPRLLASLRPGLSVLPALEGWCLPLWQPIAATSPPTRPVLLPRTALGSQMQAQQQDTFPSLGQGVQLLFRPKAHMEFGSRKQLPRFRSPGNA